MSYTEASQLLAQSLQPILPPIAVALADGPPPGVPAFADAHAERAPAGCRFWELAAQGAFYTETRDHELCAIGVHTHSLAGASPAHAGELAKALEVMGSMSYVTEQDVARLPVVGRQSRCVIYAPLASTPVEPEVVLLFADSRAGLVLSEAIDRVEQGAPPALGRPACAIVPQVIRSGRAALSLGCCGARAYLDALDDGVALWGLPGPRVAEYAEQVASFAKANDVLGKFHRLRRDDVRAGEQPSVERSLERLKSS